MGIMIVRITYIDQVEMKKPCSYPHQMGGRFSNPVCRVASHKREQRKLLSIIIRMLPQEFGNVKLVLASHNF